MKPELVGMNVRARCPECDGAITTFEHRSQADREHGHVTLARKTLYGSAVYPRVIYLLLSCAGCGRAGLAEVICSNSVTDGVLVAFFPRALDMAALPGGISDGIVAEYREAEVCASVEAWRAASALLRSTLEKTLRANGYETGSLAKRIDEAAADGVITTARAKRAHDDIRVLGNDVLHDEWREVTEDEVQMAHRYAQRILEDLYDDRGSVEAILKAKKRL